MQENKSSKCHIGFFLSILCPAIFLCLLAFAVLVPYLEDLLFGYIRIMPVGLVVALVLSIIGVKEAKKYNLEGKGLGIAGIIISLVSLLIFLFLLYLFVHLAEGLANLLNEAFKSTFSSEWVTALMYSFMC
ncbi:MAG: hypothetical protein K6A81_12140 [Clostridiales bacterium]|nr:hypothetical protein [Clostridiales bacterium]